MRQADYEDRVNSRDEGKPIVESFLQGTRLTRFSIRMK